MVVVVVVGHATLDFGPLDGVGKLRVQVDSLAHPLTHDALLVLQALLLEGRVGALGQLFLLLRLRHVLVPLALGGRGHGGGRTLYWLFAPQS